MQLDPNYDPPNNLKKNDRILVLEPFPGLDPKSTSGLIDKRLFTKENNLHAVKEPDSNLWYFKYDQGVVPEPIRMTKYTSFAKAKEAATSYFEKRNVRIKEVID